MDLSKYGIDVNGLNTGNSTSPSATIPGLDNLQGMLGTITVISIVLGIIFLIAYIFSVVQRMRADRAMIAMHKDIAAIKVLLEQREPVAPPTPKPLPPNGNLIAQAPDATERDQPA